MMNSCNFFFIYLWLATLVASSATTSAELPTVTLPWGIWQANDIDATTNVSHLKDSIGCQFLPSFKADYVPAHHV